MEYTLIRSRRRHRSASLSVNRAGEIIVRAPLYMPKFTLDQFVRRSRRWIDKRRALLARPRPDPVIHFTPVELEAFIRRQVTRYSTRLNLYPSRVRLTEAKTYWGSCSPRDLLSFSSRLRFALPAAVEYVVVHELCHLRHRGHGPRFWALVQKTYPSTPAMRKLLRQLHLPN